MSRYKLREGHKHYHEGVRYEGRKPGRPAEHPDELELDDVRAERMMNKLIALDGPHKVDAVKEPKAPEPEKEAPESAPEEVSAVASDDAEQAQDDSDEEDEAPASDSDESEDTPEDEPPSLSAVHLGAGKWNVMQGDKQINDVPLSEDEAKALADGGVG